ncbi:hypothetical protein GPECTOR_59g652 [Gonium pectorale]|uniref:DUF1538 domain-containing protein n=1 Tax=Gonium pectorale TaxID=33097 RepID=A0A150G5E8_GONPE|nr:hypothetical protein GPECTOR_59g652 [Gonium pectorale]|eukprot:KXZ45044.1 hypothetical protein GPECTOR_59g652 [Gonium pectorale]
MVDQLKEQILAVLPISLLLVFVIGVFFQKATNSPGQQAYGLVCAIFGLLFFMDGLRVCVMPLGELVGSRLPEKYPTPVVLLVAGCLGILVTYAEPAIASLSPLAQLVDKNKAPYLYFALNEQREMLVLSIGLGVGAAAVVGTLRFIKGWSLKPIIYGSLVPTIALACYMQWGNPDLAPLLGLAWDCGAVTTGPVTVPILLAMGIGVMASKRQQRLAKAAYHNAVDTNTGQTLEGFGVVTLASVFPILAVEVMGIMISVTHSKEDIIRNAGSGVSDKAVDRSPIREVVFAIRAIMPLITALLLLVVFVIREPHHLAALTAYTVKPGADESAHKQRTSSACDNSIAGNSPDMGGDEGRQQGEAKASAVAMSPLGKTSRAGVAAASVSLTIATSTVTEEEGAGTRRSSNGSGDANVLEQQSGVAVTAVAAPGPVAEGLESVPPGSEAPAAAADGADLKQQKAPARLHAQDRKTTPHPKRGRRSKAAASDVEAAGLVDPEPWYVRYGGLIVGILLAQGGMIMFNIGLTYGFTALGDQAGTLLPAAYLEVDGEPKSPYYSYAGGIVLVMVVAFSLGFMATRAEPALRVLGKTVQHLSGGSFTAAMLIYAVSIGVGSGMAVGSTKILFGVPLVYIILVKYAIAVTITVFSTEDFTCIAWDSAGVTTGPVTVPFVLSLGIGFSKATGATEGFGILTAASVAPIISVLLTNLLRNPAKASM